MRYALQLTDVETVIENIIVYVEGETLEEAIENFNDGDFEEDFREEHVNWPKFSKEKFLEAAKASGMTRSL